MANRRFTQFMYSFHKRPVLLTCKFKVLATNASGTLGFAAPTAGGFGAPDSSLISYGNGIAQVFGYTSTTPTTGNNCATANFQVQLQDNYSALLGWDASFTAPVTTSSATSISSGLSLGTAYQIDTLGTSTTANWQTVGLPLGFTAAVGQNFIAKTASAGTGTGKVKPFVTPGFTQITLAGDPNPMLQPVGTASGFQGGAGGYLFFQTWGNPTVGAGSAAQPLILAQPVDGTIIELNLWLAGA